MCGIAGQLRLDTSPVDRDLVKRMTRRLSHRGPDGEGFYFGRTIGLGHRRLSIIDLETGAQPMIDDTLGLCVTANNEIYNYVELRRELETKGHRFETRSDTEVILRLFAEERENSFSKLEGMFGMAIWDARTETLLLARDRFGIKPLYYFRDDGCLLFASELKALLEYRGLDRTLSPPALDAYFASLAVREPQTALRHVHKVPGGHYLSVRKGTLQCRPYWDPGLETRRAPARQRKASVDELACGLRNQINRSVEMSLRSDVPVGLLLSGGLDSSTLTAFAARKCNGRLHVFSAGFREAEFDESAHARAVANTFGARFHHVVVTKKRATEIATGLADTLDEPFADSSSIPTFAVCELASAHVKAVLSGEGGDELFGGYPWHDSQLVRRSNPAVGGHDGLEHPARVIFTAAQRAELYSKDWQRECHTHDATRERGWPSMTRLSSLSRVLVADVVGYLPSDILFKSDRISMLHSLEIRVPFLNHELALFSMRLPDAMKVNGRIRKYLLRRAMRGILPARVLTREKKGFSIPLDLWLWQRGAWRDLVYDTIFSQRTRARGQFKMSALEHWQREHDGLQQLHGYRLWAVFVFEMWQRANIDRRGAR